MDKTSNQINSILGIDVEKMPMHYRYFSMKYPCSSLKKKKENRQNIGIGPGSRQPDWHLAEAAGIRPGSWHPAHYREMASGGKKCQLQQADKLLQLLVPRADRIPSFWPIGEGPTLRPPPGPKRYKTMCQGRNAFSRGSTLRSDFGPE